MSRPAETETAGGASASPPKSRDRTNELGRALVRDFYMVAKTAAMFEFTNVVTRDAVETFLGTLKDLFGAESRVLLQVASDCVFVNETRLKIDFEGFAAFKFVVEAMKERDIGAIVFSKVPTNEDLRVFLTLFIENDRRVNCAREQIEEGLRAEGVTAFELEEHRDLPEHVTRANDVSPDDREVAKSTYFKSIFIAKQFIENLRGSRSNYFRKAKRLVHSIVDMVAQNDSTLLALTQIKNFDDFLFTHSANVCVLAVAIGQQLGLPKTMLSHLGLAALLHDVGMTEIPRNLLNRQHQLSPEERAVYSRHPEYGARAILKTQGVTEAAIRCALVAYEHHRHDDGGGFPMVTVRRPRDLMSRIVALVDFYDTITTPGPDGNPLKTPEEAVRILLTRTEGIFEPGLVKVFVNTIGTYPLGTVVRLDSGEIAVVVDRPPELSERTLPVVKVVTAADGARVEPFLIDLNDADPATAQPLRMIVETVPAAAYFEDISEFTDLL